MSSPFSERNLFFQQRIFKRWLGVMLRALHLLGVCGLVGGVFFQVDAVKWSHYLHLALVSGVCLLMTELWEDRRLLQELRGVAIILKLIMLAAIVLWPAQGPILLSIIILVSGVASHAPRTFRHHVWIGRILKN